METTTPYNTNAAYGSPTYGNQSPTISVGEWLITFLISAIPLVGFIMLFVWAFSSSTPPSKANYAKATLLILVIFMVLGFLFASSIAALFMGASGRHY
jgi:hypothetical protein